jgi:lysophospholipase L1-like esterase
LYSKSSIYAHRKRDRKKAVLSFAVVFLAAVVVALGAAVYWEKVQQKHRDDLMAKAEQQGDVPKETPTQSELISQQEPEQPPEQPPEQQAEAQQGVTKEEQQPEASNEESKQAVTQTPVENTDVVTLTSERILNSAALVPNSGFKVSDEYFDDAAFVGDSITEGIKLYEIMSNATVVAARGINLDTVFTDDQIRTAGGNTTVMGALEAAAPKKIYIMFGANGVGWFTEQHFTDSYTKFVQKVKEQHPDSEIFLQSILPVTQKFDDSRDDISNAKINTYNELVVEIAEKEKVHYLDVASAFKDDKGCLPEDSNGDGMHFGGVYYNKWFDYLKTHTIAEQ